MQATALSEWLPLSFTIIDAHSFSETILEDDVFLFKYPASCSIEMHSTFTHIYQLLRMGEFPELRTRQPDDSEEQFEHGVEMLTEWSTHKAILFKPPIEPDQLHYRESRDQLWLLCSPVTTPDNVLRLQCRTLYQTFCFFQGSMDAFLSHCFRTHEDAVARQTPKQNRRVLRADSVPEVNRSSPFALALSTEETEDRLDYNKGFRQVTKLGFVTAMRDLLPLFESFHAVPTVETDIFRMFRPLVPSRLPVSCYRFIVTASQLLSSVIRMTSRLETPAPIAQSPRSSQNPNWNLGAVLFFDHSVLASQLDPELTRWVLCAVALRRHHPELARDEATSFEADATPRRAFQAASTSGRVQTERFSEEKVEIECVRVFLDEKQADALRSQRSRNARSTHDEQQQQQRQPTTHQSERHRHKHGEFLGLYVIFLRHLTLAVVLELPALYNQRHTSLLRLSAETPLTQLQDSLLRASGRATGRASSSRPSSRPDTLSAMPKAPEITAYGDSSPSIRRYLHGLRKSHHSRRHSTICDPVVLTFLSHELRLTCDLLDARALEDALVGVVPKETGLRPSAKAVPSIGLAHALFEDPQIDQVILGDHLGYTYAQRNEVCELHFWKPIREEEEHFSCLEGLETDARTSALI